jgi:Protein of unknown function with HXXEE motif
MDVTLENGTNKLTQREKVAGAVFVAVTQAAQFYLLGRATFLLTAGMLIAYFLWIGTRWKKEPDEILPYYLLAVAVHCLHFAEEFFTGFHHEFAKLFGYEWSESEFVVFNLGWLLIFALAVAGIKRGMPLAYLVLFFLAIAGGIGNGIGHLFLAAMRWRYFPGVVTAPFCLIMGIMLLVCVFRGAPKAKES